MLTEYLSKIPFYNELSQAQKELLAQNLIEQKLSAGQIVSSDSNSCKGFVLVMEGKISAGMISQDGREAELFTLSKNDMCIFSASCLFLPSSFHVQITAQTDCRILVIPSPVIAKLRENNIHVELFAYKTMTARFANVMAATEEMLFVPVEKRLAKYLSAAQSPLKITQEELARKLGTAREVISRLLSSLRKDGIIETQRGQIKIIKPFLLKELALK